MASFSLMVGSLSSILLVSFMSSRRSSFSMEGPNLSPPRRASSPSRFPSTSPNLGESSDPLPGELPSSAELLVGKG